MTLLTEFTPDLMQDRTEATKPLALYRSLGQGWSVASSPGDTLAGCGYTSNVFRSKVEYLIGTPAASATMSQTYVDVTATRTLRDRDLTPHFGTLKKLASLAQGWDSYDGQAPNAHAIEQARRVLEALFDFDVTPSRVVASAEGGVGISFIRKGRLGAIECLNTGSVIAVLSDRRSDPEVWGLVGAGDVRDALTRIAAYLA